MRNVDGVALGKTVGPLEGIEASSLIVYKISGFTVLLIKSALVALGSNSGCAILLAFLKKQSVPTPLFGMKDAAKQSLPEKPRLLIAHALIQS